jgi:methionyl-tRNA formyltransferase
MKVLFVGSKGMGVLALEELLRQQAELVAVISRWDDPTPGQWYPSVTEAARRANLPLYQPKDINDPAFVAQMKALKPDIMLTAFYPTIYKPSLIGVAYHGSVNLHFAPLPRYRGSYPGAWAIINGEKSHGVTMHYMDPGVDSGDIIGQLMVDIEPCDTGFTLYRKCERAGVELLRKTWPLLTNASAARIPQNTTKILYHDRAYPYGGVINFGWAAKQVHDFIRALTFPPFPNPFTFFNRRKLTVMKSRVVEEDSSGEIGQVIALGDSLRVQARGGCVDLLECRDNRGKCRAMREIITEYGIQRGNYLGR